MLLKNDPTQFWYNKSLKKLSYRVSMTTFLKHTKFKIIIIIITIFFML